MSDLKLNIGKLKEQADELKDKNFKLGDPDRLARSIRVDDFSRYDRGYIPSVGFTESEEYRMLLENRAEQQPNVDKLGNMLTRGIAKAGISVVEPFGYLLDFEQMFTSVNEVETEYGNAFNNWLIKQEESLDRALPIYTKDDKPTIGSSDWFLKNGDQILKSLGYFVPGIVGTKVAHSMLKGSRLFEAILGETLAATKARNIAAPLLSVTAMNYNEHMRSAVETFAESKEKLFADKVTKGLETLNAKLDAGLIDTNEYNRLTSELNNSAYTQSMKEAADLAEQVVKRGKFNIPLELVEYITLFKYMGGSRAFSPKAVGALTEDMAKAARMSPLFKAKVAGQDFLKSGISEYLQEVNTGFIENEARRNTDIATGTNQDYRPGVIRYLEHVGSYEGLTEGLSGFIGGAGMQTISHILSTGARKKSYEQLRTQAETLLNPEKFEQANKLDFLNTIVRPAFETGTTENVINILDGISKASKEDAAKLGFGNDYKEKAELYKTLALDYESAYNDLSIGYQNDPLAKELLLGLKANNILSRQNIKELDEAISIAEEKYTKDEANHPLKSLKDKHRQIKINRELVREAMNDYLSLPNINSRSETTNETKEEISKRIERINQESELLTHEIKRDIEQYTKSKYVPSSTEDKGPNITTNVNDKGELNVSFSGQQESTIVNPLMDYLNNQSSVESTLIALNRDKSLSTSMLNTTDALYKQFISDKDKLKSYKDRVLNDYKDKVSDIIKEIGITTTPQEIDKIAATSSDPNVKIAAELRKNKLAEEKRNKEEIENAKKGKKPTGKEDAQSDEVVEEVPEIDDAVKPDTKADKDSPPSSSSFPKGSTPNPQQSNTKQTPTQEPIDIYNYKLTSGLVEGNTLYTLFKDNKFNTIFANKIKETANINSPENLAMLQEELAKVKNDMDAIKNSKLSDAQKQQVLGIFTSYYDFLDGSAFVMDRALKNVQHVEDIITDETPIEADDTSLSPKEELEESLVELRMEMQKELDELISEEDAITRLLSLINKVATKYQISPAELNPIKKSHVGEILRNPKAWIAPEDVQEAISLAELIHHYYQSREGTGEVVNGKMRFIPSPQEIVRKKYNEKAIKLQEAYKKKQDIENLSFPEEEFEDYRIDTVVVSENIHYDYIRAKVIKGKRVPTNKDFPYKIIDGATAAAYVGIKYIEDVGGIKHTIDNDLIDRKYDLQLAPIGSELRYVFDPREEDSIKKDADENYINNKMHIKIQLKKDGKWIDTDTWIHNLDWIINNVAPDVSIGGGVTIPNLPHQIKNTKAIRKHIYNMLTEGKEVYGKLTGVEGGWTQSNVRYEKGKVVLDSRNRPVIERKHVKDAMPDINTFGIVKSGSIMTGVNTFLERETMPEIPNGLLLALFKFRGEDKFVPIYSSSLDINSKTNLKAAQIAKSIINVTRAFLNPTLENQSFLRDIDNNLVEFFDQFVNVRERIYLDKKDGKKGFFGKDKYGNLVFGVAADETYYNYYPSKTKVKFTKTVSGSNAPVEISLDEYIEALTKTLSFTPLSVKLDKINTSGEFNLPVYDSAGKRLTKAYSYPRYNDFIKDVLTTTINGTLKYESSRIPLAQFETQFRIDGLETPGVLEDYFGEYEVSDTVVEVIDTKEVEDTHKPLFDEDDSSYSIAFTPGEVNYDSTEFGIIQQNYLTDVFNSLSEQEDVVNYLFGRVIDNILNKDANVDNNNLSKSIESIRTLLEEVFDIIKEADINNLTEKQEPYLALLGINTQERLDSSIDAFNRILPNYDRVVKYLYDLAKDRGMVNEEDLIAGEEDNMYERIKYSPHLEATIDPRLHSGKFRLMLSTVNQLDFNEDGKVVSKRNSLGFKVPADIDYLYDHLLIDIAGQATNLDEAIAILEDRAKVKPVYLNVINKLKSLKSTDSATSFKTLFVNNIIQSRNDSIKTLRYPVYYDEELVGYRYVNSELSATNGYKGVIAQWVEGIKSSNLINYTTVDGIDIPSINSALVEEVATEFRTYYKEQKELYDLQDKAKRPKTAFTSDEYLNKILGSLSKLGLNIDLDSFKTFIDSKKAQIQNKSSNSVWNANILYPYYKNNTIASFLGELLRTLEDATVINEPFIDNKFNFSGTLYDQYIVPLSKQFYRNNSVVYSLSTRNSNNDNIWTVRKYNRLSSIIAQIKQSDSTLLNQLLQTSISKFSPFLRSLQSDRGQNLTFNLHYFDALTLSKMAGIDATVLERGGAVNTSQNTMALNLFQNQGYRNAYMIGITYGDSSQTPVFEITRPKAINNLVTGIKINESGELELSPELIDYAFNYVKGEYKRIIRFRSKIQSTKSQTYNKGAERFILHGWLDYQNLKPRIGTSFISQQEYDILYTNDVLNINRDTINVIKKLLRRHLTQLVTSTELDFINSGTITVQNGYLRSKYMDNRYLAKVTKATSYFGNRLYKYAIADFALNNYFFNIDQHLLTVNDPAHFTKAQGEIIDYSATAEAMQKRLKSALTPYAVGNLSGQYNRIVVNDPDYNSTIEELKKRGYKNITSTDGFEWLEDTEYFKILLSYDVITKSQYDKVMERIAKDPDNYKISDLDIPIQVLKPISFTNVYSSTEDTIYPDLTKSSYFGLLPQVAKGSPKLVAIRQFMKDNNIQRLSYSSAVKVKDNAVFPLYERGNINENLNNLDASDYISIHDRQFDGLNTISPHSKTKILTVTQVNRGLFSGLRRVEGFEYNGNTYTGEELELEKEWIRKRLFDLGIESLQEKLGITIDKFTDEFIFTDLNKIKNILLEEANSRQWETESIKALKLDQESKTFVLPFIYNSELHRIESLLYSIINKQLVKHKIPGNSWVQIPGIDFQPVDIQTDINNYTESIIPVAGVDLSKGLSFVKKDGEVVKPAQIIVTWNFKDNYGKDLDIGMFMTTDENGKVTIDINKLPKELLEGIGFRIPNQDHGNMLPFEIVGFLPKSIKDTVIVPSEIVYQMGSDFDIDKLYSYLKEYYYNPLDRSLAIVKEDETELNDTWEKIELSIKLNVEQRDKASQELNDLVATEINKDSNTYKILSKYNKIKGEIDYISNRKPNTEEELVQIEAELDQLFIKLDNIQLQISNLKDGKIVRFSQLTERLTEQIKSLASKKWELVSIRDRKFTERNKLINNYIDIHKSVLLNPEVYDKMTTSIDFADIYEEAKDYIPVKYRDINSWIYQRDSYISQQSGADLISVYANYNTLYAIFEGKEDIRLTKENANGDIVNDDIRIFEGLKLSKLSDIGISEYDGQERTTSNNLVMLMNAVIDNANNPIAGYININEMTAGASILLSILKDSDNNALNITQILAYINQPVIKHIVGQAFSLKNDSPRLTNHKAKQLAIAAVKDRYVDLLKQIPIPEDIQKKTTFTVDELKANREWKDDYNYITQQLVILDSFAKIENYFEELDKIRKVTLTLSKEGLGKNYSGIIYQDMLSSSMQDYNYINPNFKNINSIFFNTKREGKDGKDYGLYTEYGHYIFNSIRLGRATSSVLGFDSYVVESVMANLKSFYESDILSQDKFNKVLTFIRQYAYSGNSNLYDEPVNRLRVRLMYNKNNKSLVDRITELLQNPKYKNNAFLNTLRLNKSVQYPFFDTINHNFGSKLGLDRRTIVNSLNNLLLDEDANVRKVAQDIVKYTFVLGQPVNANYRNDISFEYLESIGFFDVLRTTELDPNHIFKAYIQHNPDQTPDIKLNKIDPKLKIVDSFGTVTDFTYSTTNIPPLFFHTTSTETITSNNISKEYTVTHLYQLQAGVINGKDSNFYKYKKIPVLGGFNIDGLNFVEANAISPDSLSIIGLNNMGVKANQPQVIKTETEEKPNKQQSFVNLFLEKPTLKAALDKVKSNNRVNAHNRQLATIYSRVLERRDIDVPITIDNDMNVKGRFNSKGIQINLAKHSTGKMSIDDKIMTLLHETNHAILRKTLVNWDIDRKLNSAEENVLVTRIDNIRKWIISELKASDRYFDRNLKAAENYLSTIHKIEKGEDVILPKLTATQFQYINLLSNTEFVAKALEGGTFSEILNNIIRKEGSILDEIKEIAKEIVRRVLAVFNIKVNPNSALEATISAAFDLILVNLEPKVNTESKFENTQEGNTPKSEAEEIYSKLGNKTVSKNVRIENWSSLKDQTSPFTNAYGIIVHIISTRIKNSNKHFGNPFSHDPAGKTQGLIKTENIKEAVEKYIDWVINSQDTRAEWIREKLKSGELKDKSILYYKELGEPSHATALDYLINKYDWNNQQDTKDIDFQEDQSTGYKERTVKNASADATIAFAYNFNSAGEKLTKKSVLEQNKKYIALNVPKKTETSNIETANFKTQVKTIVDALNSVNAKTLNIAGNGIYTMKDAGWNQEEIDLMTYKILKEVIESPDLKNKIENIRTGGQTGFDEAGAKAGMRLGIPTTILAPKGWTFRNIEGKDISNEQQFKDRFVTKSQSSSTQSSQLDLFSEFNIDDSNQLNLFSNNIPRNHKYRPVPFLIAYRYYQEYKLLNNEGKLKKIPYKNAVNWASILNQGNKYKFKFGVRPVQNGLFNVVLLNTDPNSVDNLYTDDGNIVSDFGITQSMWNEMSTAEKETFLKCN